MTDPRWQTVREALLTVRREHPRSHRGEPAIAALDSLEAEIERLREALRVIEAKHEQRGGDPRTLAIARAALGGGE